MSIIKKMRKQKAIWWSMGPTDQYGNPSFGNPVEVSCRWEEVSQEYLTATGEKGVSNAVVYVDRVMKTGDRLFQGALESDTPQDPAEQAGSYQIVRFDMLPNLKATEFLYIAYL